MKVAIIMPLAEQRGGSEVMLQNLLRANRIGPRVDYCVAFLEDGPMVAEAAAMGYSSVVINSGRIRQPHRYASTIVRIARWLRREQPDIALSWMGKAQLYTGPAALLSKVPNTWWQHSIDPGSWMDTMATLIPARRVFCDSKETERVQRGYKPVRDTRVVYCAVNLERFDLNSLPTAIEARRQLDLPTDRPIIGTVARLEHWKGVHIFLDAAAKVIARNPEVYFVVVGGVHALDPNYLPELQKQVRQLNLGGHVLFTGYQENVPLWMQSFDTFVHSAIKPEPFGTVIIEAMSLGKNVIAARAGGPTEYVQDNVNGLLTSPGDAEALAAAMQRTLIDDSANAAMREAAREQATFFGEKRLAAQVADYLKELLPQSSGDVTTLNRSNANGSNRYGVAD